MNETDAACEIATECLGARVRLLGRAVSAVYDAALRPHDMTVAQLNILVAVTRMGRPSQKAIASVLLMEKSTISRNVEGLTARGWLLRTDANQRRRRLQATAAGLAQLDRVLPAWRRAQDQIRHMLGEDGAQTVQALAHRVASGRF